MSNIRKTKTLSVTPEMAQRWLNSNTHNRPIRNNVVERYTAAMKRGEWKLTSEAIQFCHPYVDSEGKSQKETLIDGQHRLWAIVNSGATVEMTVVWGCEPDEFAVIGQGPVRTFGDILSTTRTDLTDPTLVASVCSSTARYALGFHRETGGLRSSHINAILRNIEPEVIAVTEYKKRLRKMAPRPVISTLVLARIVNPSMADLIVAQLKDAVGFTDRDPIRALHLYLAEQLNPTSSDSMDTVHYKVCHAICARLRGDHIKHLRITGEGLGWLRDAAKGRITPIMEELFESKVPANFYLPKLILADVPQPEPLCA